VHKAGILLIATMILLGSIRWLSWVAIGGISGFVELFKKISSYAGGGSRSLDLH